MPLSLLEPVCLEGDCSVRKASCSYCYLPEDRYTFKRGSTVISPDAPCEPSQAKPTVHPPPLPSSAQGYSTVELKRSFAFPRAHCHRLLASSPQGPVPCSGHKRAIFQHGIEMRSTYADRARQMMAQARLLRVRLICHQSPASLEWCTSVGREVPCLALLFSITTTSQSFSAVFFTFSSLFSDHHVVLYVVYGLPVSSMC